MNALLQRLPPKLRSSRASARTCSPPSSARCSAYLAFEFVRDSRSYGDLLLGRFPAWWFESIMPVAFALIAYRFLLHALGRKRGP